MLSLFPDSFYKNIVLYMIGFYVGHLVQWNARANDM